MYTELQKSILHFSQVSTIEAAPSISWKFEGKKLALVIIGKLLKHYKRFLQQWNNELDRSAARATQTNHGD